MAHQTPGGGRFSPSRRNRVNLYRVFPAPLEVFDLTSEQSRHTLEQLYMPGGKTSVRAIMVTNSAGDTVSPQGSSHGLTRGADRALLSLVRESADAVIVGAATVRSEPVPLPRTTPLIVLCASGDLRGHQIVSRSAPNERLIVAAPPWCQDALATALEGQVWEHLPWEPGDPAHDLVASVLSRTGGGHVLVEGGRITWEYCAPLTTELLVASVPPPRDQHQGIPSWWPGDPTQWELRFLLTDDAKMLYYRHEISPAARPSP